jgi:hypothetical protein
VEPGDAACERGLARTRLADERQALVALELEIDPEQRRARAVMRFEAPDRERQIGLVLHAHGSHPALHGHLVQRRVRVIAADAVSGAEVEGRRELAPALVGRERAARVEVAALRPAAGQRRMAGDADDSALALQVGHGAQQPPRIWVARRDEQLVARADLDDPAGVHHGNPVGELGDHRQVVADVERRDTVGPAQVAHRLQHPRLRRDVQAGRRLVADDHARPARERHRDRDALLLTARELVRVARQERVVGRQRDLLERLAHAGVALGVVLGAGVRVEHLAQLQAQPQRRVERRAGILRDVGDRAAAQPAQAGIVELGEVAAADHHGAAAEPPAAPHVAEQRHPHRRLAGARFADEPEHLARPDLERDLVDDVGVAADQVDPQVAHLNGRFLRDAHRWLFRSMPIAARAIPSVTRLVPTVSRPIASTGSSTAHGCTVIDSRFSLIIRPQSAAGGCSPKPRKLIAATRPIE